MSSMGTSKSNVYRDRDGKLPAEIDDAEAKKDHRRLFIQAR